MNDRMKIIIVIIDCSSCTNVAGIHNWRDNSFCIDKIHVQFYSNIWENCGKVKKSVTQLKSLKMELKEVN